MTRKLWLFPLIALIALAGVSAACGDDDDDNAGSEEEIAAVEDLLTTILGTDPTDSDQVDFWLEHMTDEVIEGFFGTTRKECAANAEDCIGESTEGDRFEGTTVSGSDAQTTVYDAEGSAYTVDLVLEGEVWMVNEIAFGPAELPEGVTPVDLKLAEYNFVFDESKITDGNVGFPFENIGEEAHQIVVLKTNDAYDVDTTVEFFLDENTSEDDLPVGVDEVFFLAFAPPGASGIAVNQAPLEPGDYAFICILPDAEGTPHASLGMTKDFTVPE
ncbi:MAG: hypothetical protein ABIP58_02085 [Dehalococcoidia bacterium]